MKIDKIKNLQSIQLQLETNWKNVNNRIDYLADQINKLENEKEFCESLLDEYSNKLQHLNNLEQIEKEKL